MKIIIALLLFVSCQSKPTNINQKNNSIESLLTVNKSNNKDTIDTNEFANKVLMGLAKVSDDNPTFACMDSLVSNNVKTRDFYWQVFQVILKKSDGALSESVGSYLITYLQKYPKEFAKRYSKLNNERQSKCVHFAAYEYYFSEESEKKIVTIKQSCENCNSKEKSIMEKFLKEISAEINELKEDN
jgi:hypothetical protein